MSDAVSGWVNLGTWKVRADEIAAHGHDDLDDPYVVLRSGERLRYPNRTEYRNALRSLSTPATPDPEGAQQ